MPFAILAPVPKVWISYDTRGLIREPHCVFPRIDWQSEH